MSSPRYDWWPYVKGMIRRYPDLLQRAQELKQTSITARLEGMPGSGRVSDPTADAALRELPDINRRELGAVQEALDELGRCRDGAKRMEMVRLVFWQRSHTLFGAAVAVGVSEITAKRWHGDLIRSVAKKFGLFVE